MSASTIACLVHIEYSMIRETDRQTDRERERELLVDIEGYIVSVVELSVEVRAA